MANSSLNINNYSPASVKDKASLLSKFNISSSRTADTWYTLFTQIITVQNNSAIVEVNIMFGLCPSGGDCFFRILRDGSEITAFTATSPSTRTTTTCGAVSPTTSTHARTQSYYLKDTGVSAGTHTYAIQLLIDTTVTATINRWPTESATTSRTMTLIDLAEI